MGDPRSSGFAADADGRLQLRGTAAGLCRWFAGQFLQMATAAGAEERRVGTLLPRDTLVRAGYFESFPDGATSITSADPEHRYCLSPAVCYHAYEQMAGRRIDHPVAVTAESPCFREADRLAGGVGRLWEFTMREVVFIGDAAWVASERDEWMSRIGAYATSLRLDGTLEAATDPFFGATGRGRRLLQQVKGLKYELRLIAGGESLAVASFNLHETFFGRRFAITLADGSDAHSSCVAFGLERWALAFMEQHGEAAAEALLGGDARR